MTIKRNERYPGRFSNPTTEHPLGAFKNRTSPDARDGSFLEQDWANDWDGFFSSLISVAGVTPNGQVDSVGNSQYYNALVTAVKSFLGTAATRNVGATSGSTQIPDMSSFLSQKTDTGYQRLPGGLIIQWGTINTTSTPNNASGGPYYSTGQFPIAFSAACFQIVATHDNPSTSVMAYGATGTFDTGSFRASSFAINGNGFTQTGSIGVRLRWIAIGV